LWVGLIGIAATIPLVQTIASAKSVVEIADTATAITVLITEPDNVGSGVILQRQGDIYTVITAAHVVENKVSYKITTPDDRQHEIISSSIRSAPGSIDLAVVKFKSTTKYPTAKLGNCNILKSGMDLYVAGFPGGSKAINELIFVFREGKVTANSNKVLENGYSLVYSNSTLPGMSGGAVLNSDGELVAIHGRGDRDENDIKTGFNLGIPVNRFAMVASNMGVELGGQVAAIPQNTAPKADDYIALSAQKERKGDYQGSVADLDRAIQLDPKNAKTYITRGSLKALKLQDIQEGLADLNRAIQLEPNNSVVYVAYYIRGHLKANELQDIQGGLADLNRAIQLEPNWDASYVARGSIKVEKLQDNQGALSDFNRAIQLDPKDAKTYVKRGNLKALKLQDIHGGLADFNRAIQLDPNHASAYALRGAIKQLSQNDRSGGISDLKQAAKLFQQQGNKEGYQLAIAGLKEIEGNNKKSIDTNSINAESYYGQGNKKADAGSYREIDGFSRSISTSLQKADVNNSQPIATNTSNAESYYSQADKKADSGNYREAIEDFSRSIALDARHAQAYVGRGRSKYELKDYSGAISDYKQAISIAPQYASAYFNLGLAKAKSNDLKGAISDMQQATKLYQQQGKQQDAQDAIAQIRQWQQTSNNSGF
jgi:tetratricopeptide (TPR) repeat protein